MYATPTPRRWAGPALAALVLTMLAACGPSEFELAAQKREAAEAKERELDEAPVWVGTVVGYDGIIDDLIVLDYGGKYEARIDLAHIDWVDSECEYATEIDYNAIYTAAIHKAAPIGGKIAVVRAERSYGGYERDKGFVHFVNAAGAADTSRTSLNERMVAQGVAMPDPEVALRPESYEHTLAETVAQQRDSLPPLNFRYWERFVRAYNHVDVNRVGPVGKCITALLAAEAEAEADAERRERDMDRWRRGPDGREGTHDDYSYGDERDGSSGGGGGSFNVPGGLCPTRWC